MVNVIDLNYRFRSPESNLSNEEIRHPHRKTSPDTRANTGDAADPDHDGVMNLLERAFNFNPTQPGIPSSSQTPAPAACP
jgi:hypothetical protein